MQYCPNYSVPLHTLDNTETEALVYRARCKMWACPYCAVVNKKLWQARVMLHIGTDTEQTWTFFTFTLMGKDHKQGVSSLHYWRKTWDKLMKRLKRQYGKFDYVRVFEQHKSGAFHVHMLASCRPDDLVEVVREDGKKVYTSKTVKAHLTALKLGYIHDCKPLEEDGKHEQSSYAALVASYLAKYLTKDIQGDVRSLLKEANMGRVRMIQTSQGFAKTPKQEVDRVWASGPIRESEAIEIWRRDLNIVDVDRGINITDDDFYDYSHYPNKIVDLEGRIDNNQ